MIAISHGSMGMMMHGGMMGHDSMTKGLNSMMEGQSMYSQNATAQAMPMASMHSGSAYLESGWSAPATVLVQLDGNSEGHIMVMVVPFIQN